MWAHLSNSQIRKRKKEFKDVFKLVQKKVNLWDPLGFIAGGAPNDEYNCITIHLISLLKQGKSQEEIYEFIIHELDHHFGMGINSISNEYKDKFTKKHMEFANTLTEWYKNYLSEKPESKQKSFMKEP